jgi:hypothetical protein
MANPSSLCVRGDIQREVPGTRSVIAASPASKGGATPGPQRRPHSVRRNIGADWGKEWWKPFGAASRIANSPRNATPVISAPVSEMSAQYNDYLNKYVAVYCDGSNNFVMRQRIIHKDRGAQRRPW